MIEYKTTTETSTSRTARVGPIEISASGGGSYWHGTAIRIQPAVYGSIHTIGNGTGKTPEEATDSTIRDLVRLRAEIDAVLVAHGVSPETGVALDALCALHTTAVR